MSKEEVERFQLEIVFFHSTYSLNMAKGYKGSKPKESPLSGKPKNKLSVTETQVEIGETSDTTSKEVVEVEESSSDVVLTTASIT